MIIREGTEWGVPDWMPTWIPSGVGRLPLTGLASNLEERIFVMGPMDHIPIGTTFKIWGVTYWPSTMERVRRHGWGEWFNFSHESSDRLIGQVVGPDKLNISRYSYRMGVGGISTPEAKESFEENSDHKLTNYITTVSSLRRVEMVIRVTPSWAHLWVDGECDSIPLSIGSDKPFLIETPHADSGKNQPLSPADIKFQLYKPYNS